MIGGRINSGLARAAALSPERRREIASNAAKTRWSGAPQMPSLRSLLAKIEKHKDSIGKHRDALREIMVDLGEFVESADEGIESLEQAIDHLSKYV